MSTETPVHDAAATVRRYREAEEARDAEGIAACMCPEGILRSPISARAQLQGRETIRELLEIVFARIEPPQVVSEIGEGSDQRVLIVRSRVGNEDFEESVWMRFDDGLIAELTLFIRPAPALVAFMAAIGPPLAARRSRANAVAAAAMTRPLAAMLHHGDPVAVRLAGVADRH
jgi:hypothetical protein